MTTGTAPEAAANTGLARQLARAGNALLVIFVVTAVLALFPPRLLDSTWQLRANTVLVNNGSMALLGLLLRGLANWMDPEDRDLQAGFNRAKKLAKLAVLGYLLIIPLQLFAFWRAFDTSKQASTDQIRGAEIRLGVIRKAVEASSNTAELQARLRQLPGAPLLTEQQLALPMAEIRARFNSAAEQSESRINAAPTGPNPSRVQEGIKESLRVIITSLALAVAFRTTAKARLRAPLLIDPEQQALFEGTLEPEASQTASPNPTPYPEPGPEPGLDPNKLYP